MRTLLLALVLAACSTATGPPAATGDETVTGTVTSVDFEPMTRDGNGRVQLRTASGDVAVEIPSGEAQCQAQGLDLALGLRVGDRLTVTGARARPGAPLVPCAADHAVSVVPAAGGDVTVSGEVVSVDREPMAYDGNAVLVLRTAEGERRVEIPARTNLCEADGLGLALDARPGERLTVTGERLPSGAVVPCGSPSHRVRRG